MSRLPAIVGTHRRQPRGALRPMRRRSPAVSAALLALMVAISVVVLAGCTGSSIPTSAATPAVATLPPTPTAGPTTSATDPGATPAPSEDLSAIGAAYLAAADRFNPEFGGAIRQLQDPSTTDRERNELLGDIVNVIDRLLADLAAIDFPDALAGDVAAMRDAFLAIGNDFQLAMVISSHDPFPVYGEQVVIYQQHADQVRKYLGLPPRPTDPPA